jgi:hypothetical protein
MPLGFVGLFDKRAHLLVLDLLAICHPEENRAYDGPQSQKFL